MRSALQAAKAATEQILAAQAKLAGHQASAKPVKPPQGYAGCDPAAEASIMTLAVPLVRQILSDSNADMSRVQRLDALKQAKEQVVEELTKQGVYRFQVGLYQHCAVASWVQDSQQDLHFQPAPWPSHFVKAMHRVRPDSVKMLTCALLQAGHIPHHPFSASSTCCQQMHASPTAGYTLHLPLGQDPHCLYCSTVACYSCQWTSWHAVQPSMHVC